MTLIDNALTLFPIAGIGLFGLFILLILSPFLAVIIWKVINEVEGRPTDRKFPEDEHKDR